MASKLLVATLAVLLAGCASRAMVILDRRIEPHPSPDSTVVLLGEELAKAKGRSHFRIDIANTGGGSIDVEIYNVYREPIDHDDANTVASLQPGGEMDMTIKGEGAVFLINRSDKPTTVRITLK